MYERVPNGMPQEQWKTFVDKNNEEKYKAMCRKNAANHQKQLVPHTAGSKSLTRKRAEELGDPMGKIDVWFRVHKKSDGTYVNEVAKDKGENQGDLISRPFIAISSLVTE